jgi:septum formation protein
MQMLVVGRRKHWIIPLNAWRVKKMPEKTITNCPPETGGRQRPIPMLVLASTSRYRRELLSRLDLPFISVAPHTDETPHPGEAPRETALRLAEAKARSVAAAHPDALVIGSDQVADCDGEPVGKPGDFDAAMRMLSALSGRSVVFHTGVALLETASGRCRTALTDVRSTFRALSAAEIEAYLRREAPYDCAGAVKAEGLGIALFEAIESDDPTALIGLPLIGLTSLLRDAGVTLLDPDV